MAKLIDYLAPNVPIVDPNTGNPTPYFAEILARISDAKISASLIDALGGDPGSDQVVTWDDTAGDLDFKPASDVLDMIGAEAHGDILYRDSAAWALLPAGADGKVLTTHGAGADPTWETPSGGGSDSGVLHVANVTLENAGGAIGSWQSRGLNTVVSNSIASATAIPSATITMTIASPAVITWTAHGLSNGTPVCFTTTGALPTGILANFTYYVINATANTFQISLSTGGAAINTSGAQSGVHTGFAGQFVLPAGTYDIHSTGQGIFSGVAGWRSRLYNLTDAVEQTGTIGSSASGNVNADRCFSLIGRFTISGTKTFQIQTICTGAVATFGLGLDASLPSSVPNVFTNTFIRKVS